MKNTQQIISVFLIGVFILCICVFFITPCFSQSFSPYPFNPFVPTISPFYNPFYQLYDPFFPYVPSLSTLGSELSGPVMNPLLGSIPTTSLRTGAATLVVLPQPAPTVSAYAPLGTLNLTPSTLVFLILLFTLPE